MSGCPHMRGFECLACCAAREALESGGGVLDRLDRMERKLDAFLARIDELRASLKKPRRKP